MGNNDTKEKSKNARKRISGEVTAKGLTYVIGAFGFVSALAWNEAIKASLQRFFKADNNLVSLFIYAIVVTIIAVVITMRLGKIQEHFKEHERE